MKTYSDFCRECVIPLQKEIRSIWILNIQTCHLNSALAAKHTQKIFFFSLRYVFLNTLFFFFTQFLKWQGFHGLCFHKLYITRRKEITAQMAPRQYCFCPGLSGEIMVEGLTISFEIMLFCDVPLQSPSPHHLALAFTTFGRLSRLIYRGAFQLQSEKHPLVVMCTYHVHCIQKSRF